MWHMLLVSPYMSYLSESSHFSLSLSYIHTHTHTHTHTGGAEDVIRKPRASAQSTRRGISLSSYSHTPISVRILLYLRLRSCEKRRPHAMCPRPHATCYVSSYYYIFCPQATYFVFLRRYWRASARRLRRSASSRRRVPAN